MYIHIDINIYIYLFIYLCLVVFKLFIISMYVHGVNREGRNDMGSIPLGIERRARSCKWALLLETVDNMRPLTWSF